MRRHRVNYGCCYSSSGEDTIILRQADFPHGKNINQGHVDGACMLSVTYAIKRWILLHLTNKKIGE